MVLDGYVDDYEDPNQKLEEERLEEFRPNLHHEEHFRQFEGQATVRYPRRDDSPSAQEIRGILLNGRSIAPRDPEYQQLDSPTATERSSAMTEQPDDDSVQPAPDVQSFILGAKRPSEVLNSLVLPDIRSEHERNELAIVSTNETGISDASSGHHPVRLRVDSALSEVQQPFQQRQTNAKCYSNDPASHRIASRHPSTNTPHEDEHIMSLPFRKDAIPSTPSRSDTLPAIQMSPDAPQEGSASSPQAGKLPGYQQLSKLADAAVNDLAARAQQVHRHSISSTTTQSSSIIGQYGQYPGPVATSPTGHYPAPPSAHSPTASSNTLDQSYGGSPLSQFPPPQPYFTDRRASHELDRFANHAPSLISSSSESHYAGSSPEGYSTNHTTPTDPPVPNEINSRILPAPPNLHPSMIPGPFRCEYPGCKAVPFATQYLLNSHKNVHSQSRPHYCPVKGCTRAAGGQGFKRKNEMIRHGLVHESPGYVCPFCPEREHRYPRPDNLQRHVRVHHGDKSKDDPALQDVLAKRTEGSTKQRRRRTAGQI